ncbi:MAG: addiction module protein [Magnetococcales bacterium]|nr:addiction module protein [Magnetococcales bacterium]
MHNTTVVAIESQARKLTPLARLELVDAILSSLDEPNQELDRLWSQEAEERLAAYRRGEMKAIPLDEVLAKYNKP